MTEDKQALDLEGVIDFQTFRNKKVEEETLTRGRNPLYLSHGNISGEVRGQRAERESQKNLSDFSERITRIRMSLDKINALMADLKQLSSHHSRGN